MRSTVALMKKELIEQMRSAKLWIVLGVFALFGFLNPGLTLVTPWMLEAMQDVLAESGMNITIVDVNALDSWAEFFSNISVAMIVFGTVYGGIFTREFRTGTLVLSLTKGLERYKVIISKSIILAAVWSVAFWLCFGVSYVFTEIFWDNSITQHLGLAAFCWWFYGILIVALITMFSTVFSGFGGVILGVGGVVFVESLISIIPKAIEYLPSMLMGGAALVYGMNEPGDYVASIIITAVVIVVSFAVSVPLFNKKQL